MSSERLPTPRQPGSDAATQRKISNRLRRAHGQLAAVITAFESGAPCSDTVQQLSAVSKAVDRAGLLTISRALTQCANDSSAEGQANRRELEQLFLTLS